MTFFLKRKQKKVPASLKRVRKEIPPPGRVFKDRKKYSREKAKEEVRRELPSLSHFDLLKKIKTAP